MSQDGCMPEGERLPSFEIITEILNHFGDLQLKLCMMGGYSAEISGIIWNSRHDPRICIAYADDPTTAMINLFVRLRQETIFTKGKCWRMDEAGRRWTEVVPTSETREVAPHGHPE